MLNETELTTSGEGNRESGKKSGKWHGRRKDAKKEELVLGYYTQNPHVPYRKIAEAVGVAEVTAYKVLKRHGFILPHGEAQHRRKSRNENAVLAYYKVNPTASFQEMTDALHLAQATIRKILINNNLTPPKLGSIKPTKGGKKRKLIVEYKVAHPQATNKEVADALNCSRTYVYVTLKYGLE